LKVAFADVTTGARQTSTFRAQIQNPIALLMTVLQLQVRTCTKRYIYTGIEISGLDPKKSRTTFCPGLMIAVFIHASLELRSDLLLFLFYLFRFLPLFFIIIYRRWICSQTLD
jgi:hypothetical protein